MPTWADGADVWDVCAGQVALALSPPFDPATTEYTVQLPSTQALDYIATLHSPLSTLTFRGNAADSEQTNRRQINNPGGCITTPPLFMKRAVWAPHALSTSQLNGDESCE